NEFGGLAAGFDEHHLTRPAAQRLQAYRSGSGENVHQGRAGHIRTEDVEQRFLEPVTGGTHLKSLWAAQLPPPELPRNYSHETPLSADQSQSVAVAPPAPDQRNDLTALIVGTAPQKINKTIGLDASQLE